MEPNESEEDSPGSLLGKLSTASSALTGPIILGAVLDWLLGWTPWGILSGLALGFFGCMALLVKQAKQK